MDESGDRARSLSEKWRKLRLAGLLAAAMTLSFACQTADKPSNAAAATAPSTPAKQTATTPPAGSLRTSIGFRSRKNLDEHFAKHGGEFRGMSKAEYLLAAQTLRDAPVGGDIEEIVRGDGTASRFDKASGAVIAFNRDGTIRTFFKPNDGERYFRRQAQRSH